MKERIKLFTKKIGITTKEFETRIGVSNGYVNQIRQSVGANVYLNIIREFPNLNPDWLLTGEGEMLRPGGDTITNYGENRGVMGRGTQSNGADMELLLENERLKGENREMRKSLDKNYEMMKRMLEIMARWKID